MEDSGDEDERQEENAVEDASAALLGLGAPSFCVLHLFRPNYKLYYRYVLILSIIPLVGPF